MALSWLSVDARTGAVGPDLPDLAASPGEGSPQIAVTIGQYETAQCVVPLPADVIDFATNGSGTPDPTVLSQLQDWRSATTPGRSVIIALDETDAPIWGGLVLQRATDASPAAQLSLVTLEAYLDRRYCGDKTYTSVAQNAIVADLIGSFIADGILPGLPIRVQTAGATTARTIAYAGTDDKTIYSIMQDLTALQGGPEWTIGWEWSIDKSKITPVLYVDDRLGTPVPAGLAPAAVFNLPGDVITAQLVEDYSSGQGANLVTATYGTGPGRYTATLTAASPDGRPTFEYRWQVNNATSAADVTAAAQRAVAILAPGSSVLSLTGRIGEAPMLGADWNLGDDVGYDLIAPAWVDGSMRDGVARAIGWQRDDLTVSPVLAVPSLTG